MKGSSWKAYLYCNCDVPNFLWRTDLTVNLSVFASCRLLSSLVSSLVGIRSLHLTEAAVLLFGVHSHCDVLNPWFDRVPSFFEKKSSRSWHLLIYVIKYIFSKFFRHTRLSQICTKRYVKPLDRITFVAAQCHKTEYYTTSRLLEIRVVFTANSLFQIETLVKTQ